MTVADHSKLRPRRNLPRILGVSGIGFLCCAAMLSGPLASAAPSKATPVVTILDAQTEVQGSKALEDTLNSCAASTGVTFKRTTVPINNLVQKALLEASSNSLQDLSLLDVGTTDELASSGAFAPLKAVGVTGQGYYPGTVNSGTYNGKLYILAPGMVSLALFYNKSMLSAAGVTPPKTWAELKSDAQKLTTSRHYGFAFAGVTEDASFQIEPWIWSNGGELTNLASPRAVGALQFLTSLVQDGSVARSVVTWTQDDVYEHFIAGDAAMMEQGDWEIPALDLAKFPYGIVPLPVPTPTAKLVNVLGGEGWAIAASQTKNKAAVALLKCMVAPKAALQWSTEYGLVPPLYSLAATFAKQNPQVVPFIGAVAAGKNREQGLTNYAVVSAALQTAEQAALSGKSTPLAAMTAAESQAKKGQ